MARMAVIDGSAVVNVIEADETFTLEGFTLVPAGNAGPGWSWDGETFIAPPTPPPPIPQIVSRFQAKAALANAGLLTSVETAIANADIITQLAWNDALEFRRNSPTIATLAAALGLTEAQVDDLFHAAASIEA